MTSLTEADVEQAALDWLSALGPDIAPDTSDTERDGSHAKHYQARQITQTVQRNRL